MIPIQDVEADHPEFIDDDSRDDRRDLIRQALATAYEPRDFDPVLDRSLESCAECNGSGEGVHDGARCAGCRGSGVAVTQSSTASAK